MYQTLLRHPLPKSCICIIVFLVNRWGSYTILIDPKCTHPHTHTNKDMIKNVLPTCDFLFSSYSCYYHLYSSWNIHGFCYPKEKINIYVYETVFAIFHLLWWDSTGIWNSENLLDLLGITQNMGIIKVSLVTWEKNCGDLFVQRKLHFCSIFLNIWRRRWFCQMKYKLHAGF